MVDHLSSEQIAAMGAPAEGEPVAEAEPVAEPVGTESTEAATEGALTETPAEPVATGPDWGARIEEWGGEDTIKDAVAIANALRTDEGIEALVREGLAALGLDPEAALTLAKGEEPPDPDALLTRAEFEAERNKDRQSFAEAQRQQQETVARGAVEGVLTELGVADDEDARRMVLTYAQTHVSSPDELDPQKLAQAVQQGYADYEAAMERAAQKYLTERKEKNETVPGVLRGGGAPANEATPAEKPKSMEEARAAVRRAMPNAFARD